MVSDKELVQVNRTDLRQRLTLGVILFGAAVLMVRGWLPPMHWLAQFLIYYALFAVISHWIAKVINALPSATTIGNHHGS